MSLFILILKFSQVCPLEPFQVGSYVSITFFSWKNVFNRPFFGQKLKNLNWRVQSFPICILPPPTYSLPQYLQSILEWYTCYNQWTSTDTLSSPKDNSSHLGHTLVLCILWVLINVYWVSPLWCTEYPVSFSLTIFQELPHFLMQGIPAFSSISPGISHFSKKFCFHLVRNDI